IDSGRSEWWGGGRLWRSEPGGLQLKQPGDVHRDAVRDGVSRFQIALFDARLVEAACHGTRPRPLRRHQLEPGDPRGAAFDRLHTAIAHGAQHLALEVAVSEALAALATELTGAAPTGSRRAVRRAIDLLFERMTEQVTLDAIADHAGLDKFHLSRAFRAEVGLPPHAYLTHLRIERAKQLLAAGVRPSDVAPRVGFYDQSQLHRHFRRIVGTTPGRYWTAARGR